MNHSPGPWHAGHFTRKDSGCNCKYILSEAYSGSIATVDVGNGLPISEGGDDSPPLEEAIANALLIAAAPELLALAKRVKQHFAGTRSPLGREARRVLASLKRK